MKKSASAFAVLVLKLCQEDQHLPVKWDSNCLSRIFDRGSVLYWQEDVSGAGAQDAPRSVIDAVRMTSKYISVLEHALQLKTNGLAGDYCILADFGDAVLAGHPIKRGVQSVTWKWDWDRMGVHQGNYSQENYEAAKRDFSVRSGPIPKDALFEPQQLAEFYHALAFVREQDNNLSFSREQKVEDLMGQVSRLLPEETLL